MRLRRSAWGTPYMPLKIIEHLFDCKSGFDNDLLGHNAQQLFRLIGLTDHVFVKNANAAGLGSGLSAPQIMLISVDLPAPLGPSRP